MDQGAEQIDDHQYIRSMSVDVLELVDGRSPLVVGHGRWAGQLATGVGYPHVILVRIPCDSLVVRTASRSFDSVADSLREAATALRMTIFREG